MEDPANRTCSATPSGQDLTEADWDALLLNVLRGNCTPFLGAGACVPTLESGSELANRWAKRYNYPLTDTGNLPRVAQYMAVTSGPMLPKNLIWDQFRSGRLPDFERPDEPHSLLAELPLPVYVTTNFDDFMSRALLAKGKKPRRGICKWNHPSQEVESAFDDSSYRPTKDDPVVYHLHGCSEFPQTLVLTEDDYVDFLVSISEHGDVLPPRIQRAMSRSSLLFLGYSLNDVNFRVLFRALAKYIEAGQKDLHISVQLDPSPEGTPPEVRNRAVDYLNRYFGEWNIKVCWRHCADFTADLRRRWQAVNQPRAASAS